MNLIKSRCGFTILEVMIALGVVTIFILLSMNYSTTQNATTHLNRTTASKDRVLSGIRGIAGMPAALRNSMRAQVPGGSAPVNADLYTCVNGNPPSSCQSGVDSPLTLYAPIVAFTPSLAIMPITTPSGAANPSRYDSFGSPCAQASFDCPLEVFTSFKPQCAPLPLPLPAPNPITPNLLQPAAVCSVADLIEVTYSVQLDPAMASQYPTLNVFLTPVTGTITTSVFAISGNSPF